MRCRCLLRFRECDGWKVNEFGQYVMVPPEREFSWGPCDMEALQDSPFCEQCADRHPDRAAEDVGVDRSPLPVREAGR